MTGEREGHGARGAEEPETPPGAAAARRAAARYLDLWERNQAEVARKGPAAVPGLARPG
jgi:hypothetical protein